MYTAGSKTVSTEVYTKKWWQYHIAQGFGGTDTELPVSSTAWFYRGLFCVLADLETSHFAVPFIDVELHSS